MVKPSRVLGLDLHGTLLEPGEIIRPQLIEPVRARLQRISGRIKRFLCTGNDLDFVKRKIPASILAEIDGCVLETGCSASTDGKTESVITSPAEREMIKELEGVLQNQGFPEINYFAHRLTTISMFCDHPREFHGRVEGFIRPTRFYELVHVTYSSVAVDILPRGYDKQKGLAAVAAGLPTIGVADSMNDMALLARADHALAPANLAPELIPVLAEHGRKVISMMDADELLPDVVMVAERRETEGVLEILEFLDRVVPEDDRRGAGRE